MTQIEMMEAISEQLARLLEGSRRMERQLDLHTKLLTGDDEPQKGLTTRVIQLEVSEKRRQKWYSAVIACSVASVFGFIGLLVRSVYRGN